jgi:hypothetical protein
MTTSNPSDYIAVIGVPGPKDLAQEGQTSIMVKELAPVPFSGFRLQHGVGLSPVPHAWPSRTLGPAARSAQPDVFVPRDMHPARVRFDTIRYDTISSRDYKLSCHLSARNT